MATPLLILAALIAAALAVFLTGRERRRRKTLLEALAGPFNGSVQGGLFSLYLKGSHAGLPLELRFSSDGDNFYDRIRMSLLKPGGFKFLVALRGSRGQAGALARGLKAVESGDKAWDGVYYAASDDAHRALAFLGSAACRGNLPELFALGYDNIYADNERIGISKTYWHEGDELKPEKLLKAAGLLAAMAAHI